MVVRGQLGRIKVLMSEVRCCAGSADLEQVPLREVDTENEDLWERKLARAGLREILLASLPS